MKYIHFLFVKKRIANENGRVCAFMIQTPYRLRKLKKMGIKRLNTMAFLRVIVENDGHWFVKYEHQLPIQLTTRNVNSKMITTWQISLLSMDIYTSSLV